MGAVVGVTADDTGASSSTSTTTTIAITDNGPVMTLAALVLSVVTTTTGAASATSVTVTVTLDASLTYVSSSGSGWACSAVGQVVTCTRAMMANGAAPTITINVTTGAVTATTSTSATCAASNATTSTATPDAASVLLVAKDATSGVRCPASSTEWGHVMTLAGINSGSPSFLWLCQEPSGNLADSIGACTLTAANTPAYATAVSGWARKAISWTDGGTAQFGNTSAPPDGGSSSLALLCYQYVAATPSGTRLMASLTTFAVSIGVNNSGEASGLDNAIGHGSEVITDGAVRPFFLVYDRAASSCTLYTGEDVIDCTYASSSGKNSALGAYAITNPTGGCLYAAQLNGTAAELSQANVKSILNVLGWTTSY